MPTRTPFDQWAAVRCALLVCKHCHEHSYRQMASALGITVSAVPSPPPSTSGPPYGGGDPVIPRILIGRKVLIQGTVGVCYRCGGTSHEPVEYDPRTRGGRCRKCGKSSATTFPCLLRGVSRKA